jgi:ubiquitin carboxyl-terminal hydrolase 36/42
LHGYDHSVVQVYKCSVASTLENAAYLLFYVKQGSSPWFSTLLEKEDKCPLDGSVSLEEQGEIALVNKEEAASCQGQGNGPTLVDK